MLHTLEAYRRPTGSKSIGSCSRRIVCLCPGCSWITRKPETERRKHGIVHAKRPILILISAGLCIDDSSTLPDSATYETREPWGLRGAMPADWNQ
jgi:hypothetical protein